MGRSRSRSIERRGLLTMEVYPSFVLLFLTWTAQELFCNPAPGSQIIMELNTDPVDVNKFRQDSLAAHNTYRAKHGVPALKLNDELNALAQEWANQLIHLDNLEHSNNNNIGENLYGSNGMAAQDQAQGAVDYWYSEIKDYTFGNEGGQGTGHFTQVVWKGSTDVGVGVAQEGSKVVVVSNYSPPGNMRGQYADNVPPPQ